MKGKYYFNFPFKLLKFRNLPQCGPKLQRKSFMEPAPGTFFPTTADLESHYGARPGVDARWRNWHGPNRKCWPNGPWNKIHFTKIVSLTHSPTLRYVALIEIDLCQSTATLCLYAVAGVYHFKCRYGKMFSIPENFLSRLSLEANRFDEADYFPFGYVGRWYVLTYVTRK